MVKCDACRATIQNIDCGCRENPAVIDGHHTYCQACHAPVTITVRQALAHTSDEWTTEEAIDALADGGWAGGEKIDDDMERPALQILAAGGSLDDTLDVRMSIARANGLVLAYEMCIDGEGWEAIGEHASIDAAVECAEALTRRGEWDGAAAIPVMVQVDGDESTRHTITVEIGAIERRARIISEVEARRPDLNIGDGSIGDCYDADPTCTAQDIIDALDDSTEDHAANESDGGRA